MGRAESLTRTKEEAEQWLEEHLPHITIVQWGGRFTEKSEFYNAEQKRYFTKKFSYLKATHKQGISVGVGIGNNQLMSSDKAEQWLAQNVPQIKLVKWAGRATEPSLFYNSSVDKEFSTQFSQLKARVKRGLEVGSGLDNRALTAKQATRKLQKLNTRYKLVDYKAGGKLKCVFYDSVRDETFEYFYSSFVSMLKRDPKFVPCLPGSTSTLELKVADFLSSLGLSFVSNQPLKEFSYRPDFVLEDYKLIIECDGLYWHCEQLKPREYHSDKKQAYRELGYRSLFFREDELVEKWPVVQSIILNQLGKSNRVFARNCAVVDAPVSFIEDNHLMGRGRGKCFGLSLKGELVSVLQVCWVNKADRELEVSRFCNLSNHTVVGGFSKLLSYAEKECQPKSVKTFVDLRYGNGDYLESLGFEKIGTHLSFKWTDFKSVYHRMKFPHGTGYDHGLCKLWDCGQSKWIKHL